MVNFSFEDFEKVEYCPTPYLLYTCGSPIITHISLCQLQSPYKHKIGLRFYTPRAFKVSINHLKPQSVYKY